MTRRGIAALSGMCALAVLVRVAAIVYTDAAHAPAEENRIIAANLAAGRGFTFTEFGVTGPTAIRGPAYPMLMAAIGPDRVKTALAVNVAAGAVSVVAAFGLVRKLRDLSHPAFDDAPADADPVGPSQADVIDRRAAARPARCRPESLTVAALFAVWPTQVFAGTLTQGLTIAVALMVVTMTIALRRTLTAAAAAGGLAGLAALTEPALALPLLVVAFLIGPRRAPAVAVVFVLAGGVVVTPWLYRNALVFGRPMPVTSTFWRDAFLGNGDDASGALDVRERLTSARPLPAVTRLHRLPAEQYDALKCPEPDRLATYRRWTIDWVCSHPAGYAALVLRRSLQIVTLHDPSRLLHGRSAAWALALLAYVLGRVVMWAGLALSLVRPHAAVDRVWPVMMAGVLASYLFTVYEPRSVVLTDALLLPVAACVFCGGWRRRAA